MNWRRTALLAVLALGFVFLYVPILILIIYSFNEGRLVTVWAGWSTKWYGELFRNEALLRAAFLSLRLAAVAGALSAILGTLAGIALARGGRFFGRPLFNTLIAGPLVLPEVVLGISLLLLFVAMQQAIGFPARRGALTIILAHTTFGLCYVALVVQARVVGLSRALEEAAMDLGARPLKVLMVITVPLLAPAILAGFLLAFTLSLDDLVIASFVSGPGATTLPMAVFSSVRLGVKPEINALATLLIVAVAIAALIGGLIVARDQLRAARRPA
jgi:putrescine transport system permease protein